MTAYGGSGGIAPFILNLVIRRRFSIILTSPPPQGKAPSVILGIKHRVAQSRCERCFSRWKCYIGSTVLQRTA